MATELVTKIATKSRMIQIPSISVIVPVFNLQSRIYYSLKEIKQAVESAFGQYELIVVDDGSTDKTLTILKCIAFTDEHIRVLSYAPNRGKGYAVRQGVLHSHGNAVMFLDGDLNISPYSIKDYGEMLATYDLVIASKRHPKSIVTIPKSRAFLSRAFNLLVKMAIGIPQKDTQAGFKVGNGEIMRTIFRNVSTNSYAFDVELLTIASIMHLKVQEMPGIMKNDRVLNIKEIVKMFLDVIQISYKYRIACHYQRECLENNTIICESSAT